MPLKIVRNDITKMQVDAIVNAANERLLGGGGVDGMIHRAAGPRLLVECALLGGCKTGSAKATRGYRLPCKWVIHAVGPVWRGGGFGEKELLASCCKKSLEIAREKGCGSVALPLISTGAYGYPKDRAMRVLTDTISDFLDQNEMTVYLVVFDKQAVQIGEELRHEIERYIDDRYAEEHSEDLEQRILRQRAMQAERTPAQPDIGAAFAEPAPAAPMPDYAAGAGTGDAYCEAQSGGLWDDFSAPADLSELLDMVDESFSQMVLRKIDERGMKDSQCYKKANIDRKHFSKIRSDMHYRPKKPTALALAIALELPLEETKELLMKAGFALSHSSKSDIIVEYFISRGLYDIRAINEALFAFDQEPLG